MAKWKLLEHPEGYDEPVYRCVHNGKRVELWVSDSHRDLYYIWLIPSTKRALSTTPHKDDVRLNDMGSPQPLLTAQVMALEALGVTTTVV